MLQACGNTPIFVIPESAFVQAQFRWTGRTESSLRPQGGMELFARVSHSFREAAERDHDKIALTLGWCNLGLEPDRDRSVSSAARGKRLRPSVEPLLSLSDAPCVAVGDTSGSHAVPDSACDSPPRNWRFRQKPISNNGSRRTATVRNEPVLRWRARTA